VCPGNHEARGLRLEFPVLPTSWGSTGQGWVRHSSLSMLLRGHGVFVYVEAPTLIRVVTPLPYDA
jgi:hypothetical protein